MLILTSRDVESILDLDACIDAVQTAFASAGARGSYRGFRQLVAVDQGAYHVVGGGLRIDGSALAGFKINGRMDGAVRGVMLLSDAQDGTPLALLDSTAFTATRTGAVAAVAARALTSVDASRGLVVGTGRVAFAVASALGRIDVVDEIVIYGRDAEKARVLAARVALLTGRAMWGTDDLPAAVREADLIVTATSASLPLVHRDLVKPGATIVALGSDAAEKQELDPALLGQATVIVDSLDQCAAAGELSHALRAGIVTVDDVHAELGEVVAGVRPGRTRPDELIVVDSTGTAIADVAVANMLFAVAALHGIGRRIDMI